MTAKLENLIETLAADTQAAPNRNQLLTGLRDALDEIYMSRNAIYKALAVEKELAATRAETITHLQETVRIQECTIEALASQQAQTSALCDKYQPVVYATEYTLGADFTYDADLLARCENLTVLFEENGEMDSVLVRVRGQL